MGLDCKIPRPAPSDPHPLSSLHFLKVPQLSETEPPSGDRVFKHRLKETFHTQTTIIPVNCTDHWLPLLPPIYACKTFCPCPPLPSPPSFLFFRLWETLSLPSNKPRLLLCIFFLSVPFFLPPLSPPLLPSLSHLQSAHHGENTCQVLLWFWPSSPDKMVSNFTYGA